MRNPSPIHLIISSDGGRELSDNGVSGEGHYFKVIDGLLAYLIEELFIVCKLRKIKMGRGEHNAAESRLAPRYFIIRDIVFFVNYGYEKGFLY